MGPQHSALQYINGTLQPTISYYDTSKIMRATEQGFRQMSMRRAKGKMRCKIEIPFPRNGTYRLRNPVAAGVFGGGMLWSL